jgi:hypothetical protein
MRLVGVPDDEEIRLGLGEQSRYLAWFHRVDPGHVRARAGVPGHDADTIDRPVPGSRQGVEPGRRLRTQTLLSAALGEYPAFVIARDRDDAAIPEQADRLLGTRREIVVDRVAKAEDDSVGVQLADPCERDREGVGVGVDVGEEGKAGHRASMATRQLRVEPELAGLRVPPPPR